MYGASPAYELPRWLGAFYVPISRHRPPGQTGRPWTTDEPSMLAKWNVGPFRVIGRAESRSAIVVVSAMYAWPARLEWWWRRRWQFWILELALRIHLFRGPYAGHLYTESRFGPPDLWGRPLEKWEQWFV